MKNKKGMSLIVLVITILVMIILAGVVVIGLSSNNPISKANEAAFKSSAKSYVTELSSKITNDFALDPNLTQDSIEVSSEDMNTYVPSIRDTDKEKFCIQNGEITYIGNSDQEAMWATEIGIKVGNPFEITDFVNVDGYSSLAVASKTSDGFFVNALDNAGGSSYLVRGLFSNLTDFSRNYDNGFLTLITDNIVLSNGKILASGDAMSFAAPTGFTIPDDKDSVGYIVCLDQNLNVLKRQTYVGAASIGEVNGLMQFSNGDVGVVYTYHEDNETNARIYLAKYDSDFNVLSSFPVKELTVPGVNYYPASVTYKNSKIYTSGYIANSSTNFTPMIVVYDAEGNYLYEYRTAETTNKMFSSKVLSDGSIVGINQKYNGSNYSTQKVFKYNQTTGYQEIALPVQSKKIPTIEINSTGEILVNYDQVVGGVVTPCIMKLNKNLVTRWNKSFEVDAETQIASFIEIDENTIMGFGRTKSTKYGSDGSTQKSLIVTFKSLGNN